MNDLESWCYVAILTIGLAAAFGTLFRKDDTEEDNVGLYDDGSSDELLKAKLTCLMMAQSNTETHRTADDIVKDAQKFWDFLMADETE